ncbi:MAG: LamG domain-containing protein [Sedimentisphaerales bacterium]|nr:LamG domain-containing protein [Sedimentisphaerales bacterium]
MKKTAILCLMALMVTSVQAELVGMWNFDWNTFDFSGYGNHGMIYGDPEYVPGYHGQALDFYPEYAGDDLDDAVWADDSPSLDITDEITVEGYIYLYSLGQPATIAGKWLDLDGNDERGYLLTIKTDGTPRFYISHEGELFPFAEGAPINTGQTYHIAGTFDGEYIRIYVNGSLAGETYSPGAIYENDVPLIIGANLGYGGSDVKFTDGIIDEVRIWNEALGEDAFEQSIVSLTPECDLNPVGTEHTVVAEVEDEADGVPVRFTVLRKWGWMWIPWLSEIVYTEDGFAEFTYTSEYSGLDKIFVNVVGRPWENMCAYKYWLLTWVTGGGTIKDGKKPLYNISGNVGYCEGEGVVGNITIQDHANNVTYHINEFTSLDFEGPSAESPYAPWNTAIIEGVDRDGWNFGITIKDLGEPGSGIDTISVNSCTTVSFIERCIDSGNYQVHCDW